MKAKTKPAPKTKLAPNKPIRNAMFLVPQREDHTPDGGFPGDFQELCSLAMDRAIGIEKASLRSAASLNASVIDIYKNAFWFAPVVRELLDTAARSVAFCTELQMNWLTIMAPHASEESETLLHVAAPRSKVARSSRKQKQDRNRTRAKAA